MILLGSYRPTLGHSSPTTETFHNEFSWLDSALLLRSQKNLLVRYNQNLWRPQVKSTVKYVKIQKKGTQKYIVALKDNLLNSCEVFSAQRNAAKKSQKHHCKSVLQYPIRWSKEQLQCAELQPRRGYNCISPVEQTAYSEPGANCCISFEFRGCCNVTLWSRLSPLSLEGFLWTIGKCPFVPVGLTNMFSMLGYVVGTHVRERPSLQDATMDHIQH